MDAAHKGIEDLSVTAKDLNGKVGVVTDATNKITDTTATYRDTVLNSQGLAHRNGTDPKVLGDLECKAKQILIEVYNKEGKNTLAKSLTKLKDKANNIINDMSDSKKPPVIRVEVILKTRTRALILMLNSKEAVAWLKDPANEVVFTEGFLTGSHIKE